MRDGDVNTRFFDRMASGRRKRNFIEKLEVTGLWVIESEREIEAEIIKFFTNLYTSIENAG